MRKIFLFVLCMLLALPPFFAFSEEEENPVRLRALLIGCDYFVSQDSTAPAAGSNVTLIAQALLRDTREYRRIVTEKDSLASPEELRSAIDHAYGGADENDVSLFYISTHGVYPKGQPLSEAALLLSDGEREHPLTAGELAELLSGVQGKKILILDACNSGAFIGKGLSLRAPENPFAGDDYFVLCSAGGSEESWYWKSQDDGDPSLQYGASYFATVLSKAFSPRSASDMNADGVVTLEEMYAYLYTNYAASTPQMYPQNSAFPLFTYDVRSRADHQVVSGLSFDQDVLLPGQNAMTFSYTLHEEARVYYQLIYYHQGKWDFEHAQMISESALEGGSALPGRKMRTLSLETEQLDTAGYVMLLLITREDDRMEMQASHLVCVQPAEGEIALSAYAGSAFYPDCGEEINIVVRHDLPCSLSVSIEDAQGNAVQRIAYSQPTRPQSFPGTAFSWDGYTQDGTVAPEGEYTVRVETRTGGIRQKVYSEPFALYRGEKLEIPGDV
ncbi:MAG: caspase family protein [Clostridia bacterium]|nr:caspase family protein [Clostridia bacterium]